MPLPIDPKERKSLPIVTGLWDYFPDVWGEVVKASLSGNVQHVPGTSLHWDRSKSKDDADALGRHLLERGKIDTDGVRHSAKVVWRACAILQREIEAEQEQSRSEGEGIIVYQNGNVTTTKGLPMKNRRRE